EDHSRASQRLVSALEHEESLTVYTRPRDKNGVRQPDYTAESAEAAVRAGDAPVALIIPKGFGENPIAFGNRRQGSAIRLLRDPSDMVAPQIVIGLLQKAAMTSMPDVMAEQGSRYVERFAGAFTEQQRRAMASSLEELRKFEDQRAANPSVSS